LKVYKKFFPAILWLKLYSNVFNTHNYIYNTNVYLELCIIRLLKSGFLVGQNSIVREQKLFFTLNHHEK